MKRTYVNTTSDGRVVHVAFSEAQYAEIRRQYAEIAAADTLSKTSLWTTIKFWFTITFDRIFR